MLLTGPPDEGPYNRALFWPDEQHDHLVLSRVAQAVLRNNEVEKTSEPLDALACPLFLSEWLFGVVTIEMSNRSQPMQQATVPQVQSGAKWLEIMFLLHGSTAREKLINLVDLVAAELEHEQFRVAATEVTNKLPDRFSCQRVSLVFLLYNRVRVEALSHSF